MGEYVSAHCVYCNGVLILFLRYFIPDVFPDNRCVEYSIINHATGRIFQELFVGTTENSIERGSCLRVIISILFVWGYDTCYRKRSTA